MELGMDIPWSLTIMPVIKEVVVKESSSYKARSVDLLSEILLDDSGIYKAVLGDRNSMLKDRSIAMLGELLHLLSLICKDYSLSMFKDLFRDPVLTDDLSQVFPPL